MSLLAELKRRNVVRVCLAYVVIGWVLAQIAEFAFENFGAPDWALKTFIVLLLLGHSRLNLNNVLICLTQSFGPLVERDLE